MYWRVFCYSSVHFKTSFWCLPIVKTVHKLGGKNYPLIFQNILAQTSKDHMIFGTGNCI